MLVENVSDIPIVINHYTHLRNSAGQYAATGGQTGSPVNAGVSTEIAASVPIPNDWVPGQTIDVIWIISRIATLNGNETLIAFADPAWGPADVNPWWGVGGEDIFEVGLPAGNLIEILSVIPEVT